MFRVFKDKSKRFSCKVDVGGVSLGQCKARIILESKDANLLFHGDIKENGICEVNISPLRDLIPEDSTGKIRLEIIADNTLFNPWETDFVVEVDKSISIKEVKGEDSINESAVSVRVKVQEEKENKIDKQVRVLEKLLRKNNVNTIPKFEKLLEKYSILVLDKNVLSENELAIVRSKILKRINN